MNQESAKTLRLVWPQWQGAGPEVVKALTPELEFEAAQRGYQLGTRLLDMVAPAADGPEVKLEVGAGADGLRTIDGVYARDLLADQLSVAIEAISEHAPDRIVTFGGECSVSVAPFSYLADRYGADLAVVWIDSHPDTGLPESDYDGYHAMALSHLLGFGDAKILGHLPGAVDASRVAMAGVHVWEPDQAPVFTGWGIERFDPSVLNSGSELLTDWLQATGCRRVAIHFDVDCVDSNQLELGLGREPGGLTLASAARVISDVAATADVVGLTVAEYYPRGLIALRDLLTRLPLVAGDAVAAL